MRRVVPEVFLVARPSIDVGQLAEYLGKVGASDWASDAPSDAEKQIEVGGKVCYRSFKAGLNPNVTKVRTENKEYLENILKIGHGSVIEHANWTFLFYNASRVFTHEHVRHRVGVAISQESLRYVRLTDIPFWVPSDIAEVPAALAVFEEVIDKMEWGQRELARIYDIDNIKDFHRKKVLTSAFRRIAPIGLATSLYWTANARALRWTIELRTEPGAEVEIRIIFGKVAEIMKREAPNLFGDFKPILLEDGTYQWKPEYSKV